MGYRSEVVIFVGCHTEEDAVRFGELFPKNEDPTIRKEIERDFTRSGRYWTLHEPEIKWYPEFAYVRAMDAIVEFAKTAWDEHDLDTCGSFARVGEDPTDVEFENWEFENWLQEPYVSDVVRVHSTIDVDLHAFDKPIASNNG